jgi:death on curing protein
MAFVWLDRATILAVHDEQLAEHGGPSGIRDEHMLDSALARAQQAAAYGEPDTAALAATYAFGIARNHPFADGNKRTAFVAMVLFLALNGKKLTAPHTDCVLTILRLAEGSLDEAALAAWIRQHIVAPARKKKKKEASKNE